MMNGKAPSVLGGGFGGLQAAFYLRMKLEDRASITLISERDYFLFKPNMIYPSFGLDPDKLKVGLERPIRRKNIALVKDRVREAHPEAIGAYEVGTYPAWRLGKKALGYYPPFRFGLGDPFHAGTPWKGMETGLMAMSRLLAK